MVLVILFFENSFKYFFVIVLLFISGKLFSILSNKAGEFFYEKGNFKRALFCYRLVLISNLPDPETYNNLGNVYADLGETSKAENSYLKAIKLNPSFNKAYTNLGLIRVDEKNYAEALKLFEKGYRLKRPENITLNLETIKSKIIHDAEQLEYLLEKGLIPVKYKEEAGKYRKIISAGGIAGINRISSYGKNIYFELTGRVDNPLNPEQEVSVIQQQFKKNGFAVIDNFLSAEALEKLREFCLNSTIWHSFNEDRGYLEANMTDGFYNDLLFQLAEEIPEFYPDIFKKIGLMNMWAFKYDSGIQGVVVHADEAVINVNFWLTPDSANLDENNGGMVIYRLKAPDDWGFENYNINTGIIKKLISEQKPEKVVIPYRQNRAVIFDSRLFHETDHLHFREGYENRRINVTMTFGQKN